MADSHPINAGLDHALALVQRTGAHVIPLHPDTKIPLVYAGRQLGVTHATRDIETICAWWGEYPDALAGIAAGTSGLLIIDIDVHGDKNGYLALATNSLGFPDGTPRAYSKSGKGEHVLMLDPAGPRRDGIAADGTYLASWQDYDGLVGVDRIAGNGYVCWVGDAPDRATLAPAPDTWTKTRPRRVDSAGWHGTVTAWLDQTADGDPDGPTRAIVARMAGRDIDYPLMRDTVAALVSIGAEGRPVRAAIEAARREYTRPPYDGQQWSDKFDMALVTAIRSFGAPTKPLEGVLARQAGTQPTKAAAGGTVEGDVEDDTTGARPVVGTVDDRADTSTGAAVGVGEWDDQGLRSHQRIAARFAQYAAGQALYVDGTGWHHWDGRRWSPDHGDTATMRLLTQLLKDCWAESIADKDLTKDVQASMTAAGSAGVLRLAQARLFTRHVDEDPYLINVANGTLDLHTLELRPHDPADRITKLARGGWHPDRPHTGAWEQFLASTLPDVEARQFLQRWAGVALIGRVVEHALVIANGGGRNGKGVLSDSISHALGDYAVTAPPAMLTTGKYAGQSAGELASLMHLRGARWAVMSELAKGARLNEALMKQLTGGDTIHAKHMGQNPVDFQPSHSFFMQTNDLPAVDADAKAVWARMLVVPFTEDFTGREDKGLRERLELEPDAVLSWAVEGLRQYREVGLAPPESVRAKTAAYRDANDHFHVFLEDECEVGADYSMLRSQLAPRYADWARRTGAPGMARGDLLERVRRVEGVEEHTYSGRVLLRGIALASQTGDVEVGSSWAA